MRVNRTIWVMTVLVFVLATTLLGSAPAAQAAAPCGAAHTEPVTFLARDGFERPWTRLSDQGVAPYLDLDRQQTMVGVRSLVSSLSPVGSEARWENDTRTAVFTYGSRTLSIKFPEDSLETTTAYINDQPYAMAAFICNGTVVAPARAVTDAFRVGLKWYHGNTVVADPTFAYSGPEIAPPVNKIATRNVRALDIAQVYKACDLEPEYSGLWAGIRKGIHKFTCRLIRM